jgi:hypothetical protein
MPVFQPNEHFPERRGDLLPRPDVEGFLEGLSQKRRPLDADRFGVWVEMVDRVPRLKGCPQAASRP